MKLTRALEIMMQERESVLCGENVTDCEEAELVDAYDTVIDRLQRTQKQHSYSWLLFIVAYVPSTVFTVATCHFIDRANWIPASVFFLLVLLTLPRFKQ